MSDQQVTQLKKLLQNNVLTVMSTISSSKPESALIAFAEDEDLNIYFQTRSTSRKFANLSQNKNVSFVIGWELEDKTTVQLEGQAEIMMVNEHIKSLFQLKNSPSTATHLNHPEARFFKVALSWLKYSDYSAVPPVVWEYGVE